MNKRILIGSILAVFMLVIISMATAISTEKTDEKKESPLFKIRVQNAIQEKKQTIQERMHNIFANFVKNRIFISFPIMHPSLDIKYNRNPHTSAIRTECVVPTYCWFTKCSLGNEDASEIDWTKSQPVCNK